jgi:hypothetical protein
MPAQPPEPSFVEPMKIPCVDCPALKRMKLRDLELVSAVELAEGVHFSEHVSLCFSAALE